jgi:hypothetical protein
MFYGSDVHAEAAAALFSLIASCRLHRLDAERYLSEVARAVPGAGAEELGGDASEAVGGGTVEAGRSDHGAGVGRRTGQPLSPDGFRATLTKCWGLERAPRTTSFQSGRGHKNAFSTLDKQIEPCVIINSDEHETR